MQIRPLILPIVLAIMAMVQPVMEASEIPKIPIEPTMATPTPSVTITPTPTHTATPTQVPTQTPIPTNTLTLDEQYAQEALDYTSALKVDRCLFYLSVVEQWLNLEPAEFEYLDDPVLVLAVGAAESGCDMKVVSSVGALGIMQVMPKSWTAPPDMLAIPRVNIYWGMWILDGAMEIAFEEGNDLRYALAYYNCSYEKVHEDMCGTRGGLHYADDVLDFWYPLIEKEMGQ
jgi:hypothetical protein